MAHAGQARDSDGDARKSLRWHRAVAFAAAMLFVIIAGTSCWIVFKQSSPVDFLSYWAAAKLAVSGHAASAYDIAIHREVERGVSDLGGLLPFPYPPPFILAVAPFGVLPFNVAFPVWVIATGSLYFVAARRLASPRVVLAQPAVLVNGMIGQNGFLLSAVFIGGTGLLSTQPFVGGAILGLFVFKPQLGLLLPVAVVAAREWRAVAGAALSALLLLLMALLLFGITAYEGFLERAPQYARYMQENRWPWAELASPFAFLRWFGVPATAALVTHFTIALAGAVLVWRSWRESWEQRVPILAAASILVPPYIFTYDSLLLVVPIAWLVRQALRPAMLSVIWLLCLLPVARFFGLYSGPNTIAIAACISLVLLWQCRPRTSHFLSPAATV
jgi:hypothetical protein